MQMVNIMWAYTVYMINLNDNVFRYPVYRTIQSMEFGYNSSDVFTYFFPLCPEVQNDLILSYSTNSLFLLNSYYLWLIFFSTAVTDTVTTSNSAFVLIISFRFDVMLWQLETIHICTKHYIAHDELYKAQSVLSY